MKYDAGMTQFHGDIVAAIKSMLYGDSDKAKELASDSSPTPLREYLKKEHGARYHGGDRFDCSCSCFLVVFGSRINELGETRLQMSWSQVAKFIRDNPSEVFGEEDKSEQDKSKQSGFPCDGCGYDEKGCCNYPETPDDYCVCGDKQIPKSEGTYLEIFKEHYPNVNCEGLYYDYCPGDFFEGAMDSMCNACTNICKNCWSANAHEEWCETVDSVPEGWKAVEPEHEETEQSDEEFNRTKEELEKFIYSVDEKKMDCPHWIKGKTLNNKGFGVIEFECAMHKESFFEEGKIKHFLATHCYNQIWCPFCNHPEASQDKPVETPAPAQNEPPAFDYSILDTDTAASLRNCETVIRTETAGYFTLLGAKFKEAQDLLANHSSGTFEQWYTAMGFKRQTVYNLIKRFEFSSSPTIGERTEVFEALPLTLSYEISKPDAPAELVDKVLDGDITSNAEYQRLKKQLEEAEEKREFWIKQNSETNKENQQLRTDRNIALTRADNAERKLSEAKAKIKELECEADEADREYAAMADREDQHETLIADLKRQIKELESRPVEVAVEQDTAALDEKDKEISELKEEIERLSDNSVKSFVIKLTIEEYVQLQDIVKSSDNHCIVNAVNSARMIKL